MAENNPGKSSGHVHRQDGDDAHDHSAPGHSHHDHPTEDHSGHAHGGGHDHHGHDHHGHHHHAPTVSQGNERAVLMGFVLTFGFMIAEAVGGILSGSLALVADAGHMLTDSAALALAWAGFYFGRRQSDQRRTFGYMRFEILAGFVNAVALILLVVWVAYEAAMRLITPDEVLAGPMLVIAVIGLLVNVGVFFMLRQGDQEHVNIRGALLHVIGDLLGSVAAIVAAVAIYFTGWTPIDPILSVLLSAIILKSAWGLLTNTLNILMEGTPGGMVPEDLVETLLAEVDGLDGVEHVHLWSITSGQPLATMDVRLKDGAEPRAVVAAVKSRLSSLFGIDHSTIEIDFGGPPAVCPLDERKRNGDTCDEETGRRHRAAAPAAETAQFSADASSPLAAGL